MRLRVNEMRHLLLPLLLFLTPLSVAAIESSKSERPNFKIIEEQAVLDCEKYGNESCAARFIAMGACTYAMGLRNNKEPLKARDIGDELFMAMMKANKIPSKVLWDENNKVKANIKREVIDRMSFCDSVVKEVAIKLYKKKLDKDLEGEDLDKAVYGFSWVYINDLEKVWDE